MNEEIENIIPPPAPLFMKQLLDEDLEWIRIISGINEELLGKKDEK